MSDRPVLLFGATGQVGAHLMQILAARRVVLTPHHTEVDFILPDDLRTYIRIARPSIIINAAANTNVDGAEDSPTLAMAVNADAPRIMAEEARQLGIALVHYSTDYVFDGKGGGGEPRSESGLGSYLEGDPAHALGVYGESKWRGEEGVRLISPAHLILRTGWIYGWTRRNFFNTIRTLALEQDELRIVDDQIGTPNWARALAESTSQRCLKSMAGPITSRLPARQAGSASPRPSSRNSQRSPTGPPSVRCPRWCRSPPPITRCRRHAPLTRFSTRARCAKTSTSNWKTGARN